MLIKNFKTFLNAMDHVVENGVLKHRIKELEDEIFYVVTCQGDDLCWLDVYTRLAKLVGIDFDPTLLSDEEMLTNCSDFVRSLRTGCHYKPTGYTGFFKVDKILHLSCGHCYKLWYIPEGNEGVFYFCPHCGKQQAFDSASLLLK